MSTGPKAKSHYATLLTPHEREVLDRARRARGDFGYSDVLDEALRHFLAGRDFARTPLLVPSKRGAIMVSVGYWLPDETRELMRAAEREHGYWANQLVRAAVHELELRFEAEQGRTPRRRRSDAQDPTHAGR